MTANRTSLRSVVRWSVMLGLAAFLTGDLASEAQAAKFKSCKDLYRKLYLKGDKHKAYATTGGRPMSAYSTACGAAEGYASKKLANANALSECRSAARKYKASGKCKIIESK